GRTRPPHDRSWGGVVDVLRDRPGREARLHHDAQPRRLELRQVQRAVHEGGEGRGIPDRGGGEMMMSMSPPSILSAIELSKVISAGVGPIIVISACGLLCSTFYNRITNV